MRVRAGTVEELRSAGRRVVKAGDVPVLVLWHEGAFHAVDNRCPHMGFPLHQGDVRDGLLICHWHHARFDVTCGATLDPFADDVDCFRVSVEGDEVWIDATRPERDPQAHGLERLRRGLDENLRLVVAKSAIAMLDAGVPPDAAVAAGARFGALQRGGGWGAGLTILASVANVLDALDAADRPRALTKALAWIAAECEDVAPRRPLDALRDTRRGAPALTAWFRETVEVRDAEGAERILRTLAEEHGAAAALDAVLKACTDHRYCDGGHMLDFAVKCGELAAHCGGDPELQALLFTSLVPPLVAMRRSEETSPWRIPVDVAGLVQACAAQVPERFGAAPLKDEAAFAERLLGDDPEAALGAIVTRARGGTDPVALAEAVSGAATRRLLRFGPANEIPDWETVHHSLTFANAVAEGMRAAPSRELFRAVLDAAASVYLDRFLNVPPDPLPSASPGTSGLDDLLALYDRRGSVEEATRLALSWLHRGGAPERLLAALGTAVLREDAGFHDVQQVDLAWRRLQRRGACAEARLTLVACARFLAARYPTRRAQEQTFAIALRLHRGEALHEVSTRP